MIAFEPTPEQRTLRDALRGEMQQVQEAALRGDRRPGAVLPPEELCAFIGRHRLGAMLVPAAYGGLEYDYVTVAVVLEELAVGCAGLAAMVAATLHAVAPILIAGTTAQRDLFLPLVVDDPGLAGFALTERHAGSDIMALKTSIKRSGAGYTVGGAKCSVINAGLARFYLVFGTSGAAKGRAGLNAVVVPAAAPGVEVGPPEDKVGLRNAPTAEVVLREVFVPAEHLIGVEGGGYLLLMQTLDRGRAFSAAVAVGVARAAFEAALAYARERWQFGRPIIRNQGISFALAEMATEIEAARFLVWHACRLIDLDEDYTRAAAMAKLFSALVAERVASQAMDVFGRYGYNRTYPVDKLWRDAKALATVEGTHNVMRMVIASLL